MVSRIRSGRSGEYFVAYFLELHGIECYRVDGVFDLIAYGDDGHLVRIEVKSARSSSIHNNSYKFRRTNPRAGLSDFLFLVLLDLPLIRIFDGDEWRGRQTISLPSHEFNLRNQQRDLELFAAALEIGFYGDAFRE